jgi:hypothetical protein
MSRVGFEPTNPVFEQAKTVDALDRAATVIGGSFIQFVELQHCPLKQNKASGHQYRIHFNFIPSI